MLRRLGLSGDWTRKGSGELVGHVGREDVALTNRHKVVVRDIKGGPKPEAGIVGALSEIDLPTGKQRIVGGDGPIDAGEAEILRRPLSADIVVDADVAGGGTVGKRIEGKHRRRCRVHLILNATDDALVNGGAGYEV